MNADIEFLDVEDVLELQELLIDEFGGIHGIRDAALMESAVETDLPAWRLPKPYL